MSTTIGPGGSLMWDYPAEQEANMDKFVIYMDGEKKMEVDPPVRSVPIQELTTTPGDKIAGVSAQNALGETSKVETNFRLVTGIPMAPTNVRVGML